MLRRCVGAALVLFVVGGFVLAETYRGLITKLEKDKVTIKTRGKKKGEGKEMTFKVSADTKIMKAGKKGSEPTTVSADDVNKMIEKGIKTKGSDEPTKGVFGTIETKGTGDDEAATSITVGAGRGRPKIPVPAGPGLPVREAAVAQSGLR